MEKSDNQYWNANAIDYRLALIKIKSFVNLALNHLEPVKGEEIPEDPEFRQTLWVLLNQVSIEAEHLESMRKTLPLPTIDRV